MIKQMPSFNQCSETERTYFWNGGKTEVENDQGDNSQSDFFAVSSDIVLREIRSFCMSVAMSNISMGVRQEKGKRENGKIQIRREYEV